MVQTRKSEFVLFFYVFLAIYFFMCYTKVATHLNILAIIGAFYFGKNASSIFAPVWRERCVAAFEAMHFSCVALLRTFLIKGVNNR